MNRKPAGDHFEDILEMVEIGSVAKRQIADVQLQPLGCHAWNRAT